MRIILADPPIGLNGYKDTYDFGPSLFPPLWAAALATYLKSKLPNAEIHILHGQILDMKEIIAKINSVKPDIVGISPVWVNYRNALEIARTAKRIGAKVALGGHHASGLAKEILLNRGPASNDYCVDVVIRQDGEKAFFEWINGVPFSKIKNLVYWDNKTVTNELEVLDLNALPPIDWFLVNPEDYFNFCQKKWTDYKFKKMVSIYSRKGCGWRASSGGCIFCSRMYKELRIREPESVVQEIAYLVKKFGVDFIFETSDDFLDNKIWFEKFYNLYKDFEPKPVMRIYARTDRITLDIAKKLNELNIRAFILGVESGDMESLSSMKKGLTKDIHRKAIQILKETGAFIICNFVFGAPGETSESIKRTLEFVRELNQIGQVRISTISTHALVPLPNSLAFDLLVKKTGDKYKNRDLIDKNEIVQDWVRLFCDVSLSEIFTARRQLEFLPNHPKPSIRIGKTNGLSNLVAM